MRRALGLLVLAAARGAVEALANGFTPPFYEITAASLHDAGVQHGKMAAGRIRGWFGTPEMRSLFGYAAGPGSANFTRLRRRNAEAFPEYAREIQGISEGAQVPLDHVWAANLLAELEGMMGLHPADSLSDEGINSGHCSDIFAAADGGINHGHNEDWSLAVEPWWYFTKYIPAPGADFMGGAGLIYPGTLFGWAPSWNSKGMYLTQNSLFVRSVTSDGLAMIFAQRHALCGKGQGGSVDAVVAALTAGGAWASGASVNIVDLKERRMANVEVWQNLSKVTEVTAAMGNFSHFNEFKTLLPGQLGYPETSTRHRQARSDALPAPRTRADVMAVLSDNADEAFPIFRHVTLATLVVDSAAGILDIFCCGVRAVQGGPPAFAVDLLNFSAEAVTPHPPGAALRSVYV